MFTKNRRIKVKFRSAAAKYQNGDPAAICDQSGLLKEKAKITFPSVRSSLVEDQYQSVLNELTKSSKEKADRCNTQCNNICGVTTNLRHCSIIYAVTVPMLSLRSHFNMSLVLLVMFYLICTTQSILVEDQNQNQNTPGNADDHLKGISASAYNTNTNTNTNTSARSNGKSISSNATENGLSSISSSVASSRYLGNLDNFEQSVAAVLIKVAYGTTSTTKRSIPDNSYILGLTTVATPLLTTLRYQSVHQPQNTGSRHRNYELDLERDHALPTSAPNADILKSNNNPSYPNPNRHHSSNHDRDRHRHTMQYNSTPVPSFPNLLKKSQAKGGQPTVPMYPGDIPSYSPPSRSFFTPPLPPEYQNPFADKPTLRGTNNEGLVANTVAFNNRRPIPPPSLMPGHERIPFRPPDLSGGVGETNPNPNSNVSYPGSVVDSKRKPAIDSAADRKKALNTPSRSSSNNNENGDDNDDVVAEVADHKNHNLNENKSQQDLSDKRQEVLPNIRRILGSNGKKGDIPAVLLRQVTQRPIVSYHQPPASAIVSVENAEESSSSRNSNVPDDNSNPSGVGASPNINKSKQSAGQMDYNDAAAGAGSQAAVTTPSAEAAIGEAAATSFTAATTYEAKPTYSSVPRKSAAGGTGAAGAAAAAGAGLGAATWTWAWNIHVYLSVVLFTILAVYSLYKLLTYNKLTHLFAQSYFVYIHLILIAICIMRIFYLCFDAYNIHGTFHIFAAELLLNLPSTFLTVAFSVLILFLFLKSLNHKNNRYSALVRPLTVVVGCGVHVVLCITLHYVESYTLQNHHMYFQQQQQQQYLRRQQQQQQHQSQSAAAAASPSTSMANPPPPPRVLSLICQIIYIFICLSLGLLYLYLYRILKRILRSKSQNYIHGYQNLSYAIHITIATALLFVLLAALQIFGAVCISTARPLITQTSIVEVDWMQWGYQFSLRLIEIAIITLISWVTGLKTNVGGNSNSSAAVAAAINGDVHMIGQTAAVGAGGPGNGSSIREKHGGVGGAHQNVANFFLPCTSGSSQEQFENDYPAICNANTNLHTYTMRTGKLIYDDSYALNSLAGPAGVGVGVAASPGGRCTEYQLQEPMYQRPYDTGSIRSAVNHNIATESQRYHHHHHHQIMGLESAAYMTADYMTDATTDHYENPNFDLRASSAGAVPAPGSGLGVDAVESVAMQKLSKNTVSSGSASGSGCGSGSGSGSGSSGTSQQQMLLLQSDSCYSEPLQENSSYEFNNFERPIFKEESHASDECWPDRERDRDRDRERHKRSKGRDRKQNNGTLERAAYENPERRSSNSTNSCSSSNGVRYASYNSYERAGNPHYNGVRKSGTLNNIVNGSGMGVGSGMGMGMGMGPGPRTGTISGPPGRALMQCSKRPNGAQTLALAERSHYYQRSGRSAPNPNPSRAQLAANEFEMSATTTAAANTLKQQQQQQQQQQLQQQQHYNHNNSEEEDEEEEEEDEDDMMSGSNVECTNLITSDNNSSTSNAHPHPLGHHHLQHVQTNPSELGANIPSAGPTVAEQGFLRFRANIDDDGLDGTGQQLGAIHMPSLHKPSRSIPNALSQINSNKINNGIDC